MPPGWRLPTDSELAYGPSFREQNATRYLVAKGDFDGDGIDDIARLLVTANGKGYGLVLTFGGRSREGKHLMLERGLVTDLALVGIDVESVGDRELICRGTDAGYDWCRPGEPTKLVLRNPAILRFVEGKSGYLYYLRGTHFHRLWVSD